MSLTGEPPERRIETEIDVSLTPDGVDTWLADVYYRGRRVLENMPCSGATEDVAIADVVSRLVVQKDGRVYKPASFEKLEEKNRGEEIDSEDRHST